MHNNAIGPEVCGKPANKKNHFYSSPYVDAADKPIKNPPPCWPFDPTVASRYKLFKASVAELLTPPEKRPRKVTLLNEDIVIEAGPKVYDPVGKKYLQLRMVIPKGTPQDEVGNLFYKQLIIDMVLGKTDFEGLKAKLKDEASAKEVAGMLDEFLANINTPIDVVQKHGALIRKYYMTNTDFVDNGGHAFGTDLSDHDKKALTAYLATF